jgi:hypothetical protein
VWMPREAVYPPLPFPGYKADKMGPR